MTFIEEVSPRYIGEDRLRLALSAAAALAPLRAFSPIVISVDYSGSLPEGTSLPLELLVTAPDGSQVLRRVYRRFRPSELAFVPRSGGSFLVTFGEQWHNRWWGKLVLEIAGDRLRGA